MAASQRIQRLFQSDLLPQSFAYGLLRFVVQSKTDIKRSAAVVQFASASAFAQRYEFGLFQNPLHLGQVENSLSSIDVDGNGNRDGCFDVTQLFFKFGFRPVLQSATLKPLHSDGSRILGTFLRSSARIHPDQLLLLADACLDEVTVASAYGDARRQEENWRWAA